jgi:tetratricopeptide (TPR) repeat protein
MRKVLLFSAVLVLAASAALMTSCDKLKSRDHLNQGVNAFKNAHYAEAVEHFKQAIALDPDNPNAQLYLATAYMSQWIPGAESPDNLKMAQMATDGFLRVLEKHPADNTALASLASIAYQQASSLPPDQKAAKLDEAAKWNKKLIEADAKNKEAYYYLGVIDWAKWYPQWINARLNVHMRPEDPGPLKDKKTKAELSAQYSAIIDDGIANLNKALDIDKEYEDAMVYLSLLIREKADLLDNADDYKKQIEVADNWQQKALDTKKAKAARQPAANGITAESK